MLDSVRDEIVEPQRTDFFRPLQRMLAKRKAITFYFAPPFELTPNEKTTPRTHRLQPSSRVQYVKSAASDPLTALRLAVVMVLPRPRISQFEFR